MKTRTGHTVQLGDILRVVNGKQNYVVVSLHDKRAILARHIEIVDGTDWIHAVEGDPMHSPAKLMGDA